MTISTILHHFALYEVDTFAAATSTAVFMYKKRHPFARTHQICLSFNDCITCPNLSLDVFLFYLDGAREARNFESGRESTSGDTSDAAMKEIETLEQKANKRRRLKTTTASSSSSATNQQTGLVAILALTAQLLQRTAIFSISNLNLYIP